MNKAHLDKFHRKVQQKLVLFGATRATNHHANCPQVFLEQRLYFQSRVCDVIPNTSVAMKQGAKTSMASTVMGYAATVMTDDFRACSFMRGPF